MASKKRSTKSAGKKAREGENVFASPREKTDFAKRLDAERETSTLISRTQRRLHALGISVGSGASSTTPAADTSATAGNTAGAMSVSPSTSTAGASRSSGSTRAR